MSISVGGLVGINTMHELGHKREDLERRLAKIALAPDCYGHFYTEHSRGLELPSSTGWREFMGWVNDLPEREPPTYLGLPANAEKLLLVGQAKEMVGNLKLIMNMLDEGEHVMAEAEA